jgi:hypothetical protein
MNNTDSASGTGKGPSSRDPSLSEQDSGMVVSDARDSLRGQAMGRAIQPALAGMRPGNR